jgi:adenine phosphoribosyltransferase
MRQTKHIDLRDKIYDIADFPEKGVTFRDLTPLLLDPQYFDETIKQMLDKIKGIKFTKILAIESRGYFFASPIAQARRVGLVPVRKLNKLLPRRIISQKYATEYSIDGVKIHRDAISKGERVLIVDDLAATGGTALATAKLAEKAGGKVAALLFLNELTYLKPRQKLKGYRVISLIKF